MLGPQLHVHVRQEAVHILFWQGKCCFVWLLPLRSKHSLKVHQLLAAHVLTLSCSLHQFNYRVFAMQLQELEQALAYLTKQYRKASYIAQVVENDSRLNLLCASTDSRDRRGLFLADKTSDLLLLMDQIFKPTDSEGKESDPSSTEYWAPPSLYLLCIFFKVWGAVSFARSFCCFAVRRALLHVRGGWLLRSITAAPFFVSTTCKLRIQRCLTTTTRHPRHMHCSTTCAALLWSLGTLAPMNWAPSSSRCWTVSRYL